MNDVVDKVDGAFSTEDVRLLVLNYRSLNANQQRDVIRLLGNLEAHARRTADGASRPNGLEANPPSPMSVKYNLLREQNKAFNPFSPESSVLSHFEFEYPAIMRVTGLSAADLQKCGIPVEDIRGFIPVVERPVTSLNSVQPAPDKRTAERRTEEASLKTSYWFLDPRQNTLLLLEKRERPEFQLDCLIPRVIPTSPMLHEGVI